MVGGLKRSLSFWETSLNCPLFVHGIISSGYKLPFRAHPTSCFLRNNLSSIKHPTFVVQTIEKLLINKCISEQFSPPYCVNPLTVAEGRKLRLVLDLRHVNDYLVNTTFRYEDLRTLSQMFNDNYYFFTWDLESGYHHVDIFEEHRKFLGFCWTFDGQVRYFSFNVLPFGLSTACYCFTKLLRPLVKRWRSMSHASIVYLDDGISGHDSFESAVAASVIQRRDLLHAGFKTNERKSHWNPTRIGEWLGFVIDTMRMEFTIPQNKIDKVKAVIRGAIISRRCSARQLARIAGFLISLSIAIGPIARLFTRHIYLLVESRSFWSQLAYLTAPVLQELQFWNQNLDALNGFRIKPEFSATAVAYSDASDSGFGGYYQYNSEFFYSHGIWGEAEREQSSTYRELKAVQYVLSALIASFRHKKVRWFSDNQSACRIITVGSTKPHLQAIAISIFQQCCRNGIQLEATWLPRSENEKADALSRIIDTDDWSLNPAIFRLIDNVWGPHSIDRIATFYIAQLPRFNSACWNPGSEAVDAFCQNWAGENNWACPPVKLIIPTLRHLRYCTGEATIVVPEWPSAAFWPVLRPQPGRFANFVKSFRVLPRVPDLLVAGRGSKLINPSRKPSVFHGCPSFNMLALRLYFPGEPVY